MGCVRSLGCVHFGIRHYWVQLSKKLTVSWGLSFEVWVPGRFPSVVLSLMMSVMSTKFVLNVHRLKHSVAAFQSEGHHSLEMSSRIFGYGVEFLLNILCSRLGRALEENRWFGDLVFLIWELMELVWLLLCRMWMGTGWYIWIMLLHPKSLFLCWKFWRNIMRATTQMFIVVYMP